MPVPAQRCHSVTETADGPAPFGVLCAVNGERLPFFLDSGMDPARLGRFSFVGCAPVLVAQSRGSRVLVNGSRVGRNPFAVLKRLLRQYRCPRADAPIPFTGGAVGYLAYDLGRFVESLPDNTIDDIHVPEMHFAFYDAVAGYDHRAGRWYVATADTGAPGLDARRARLIDAIEHPTPPPRFAPVSVTGLRSNFERADYLAAVGRVKDYIAAGDIFQANLSQRFQAETDAAPLDLYAALRAANPAPFAAYLPLDGRRAVLSSSPERFLKVVDRHVETRPIKGTRPRRRADEAFNERMRSELLASEKDRAELTMIVDLERNDLGRVCRYGSVRVVAPQDSPAAPFALETHPTVHHLVADVVGELEPGRDIVDLLRASFPGGSITGAPKVRAMEIIDALEPTVRSIYTGAIGCIGLDGSAMFNIAIRTLIAAGPDIHLYAGGGIVADSRPADEYEETVAKALGMRRAVRAVHAPAPDPCATGRETS